MKSLRFVFMLALIASSSVHAQAISRQNGLLADANGRVLYTFDKDTNNKSNCNGGCLAAWPAFTAKTGAKPSAGYSTVTRDDGSLQWALDGKPLYYFAGDSKPGEANGDKQGGVWHVIKNTTASSAVENGAPVSSAY